LDVSSCNYVYTIRYHILVQSMKLPQYHRIAKEYASLVDCQITVYAADKDGSELEFHGELLEIKPQGLCIQPVGSDDEIFVSFRAMCQNDNRVAREFKLDILE